MMSKPQVTTLLLAMSLVVTGCNDAPQPFYPSTDAMLEAAERVADEAWAASGVDTPLPAPEIEAIECGNGIDGSGVSIGYFDPGALEPGRDAVGNVRRHWELGPEREQLDGDVLIASGYREGFNVTVEWIDPTPGLRIRLRTPECYLDTNGIETP